VTGTLSISINGLLLTWNLENVGSCMGCETIVGKK
jgi:hypothetical protein